jgi:uridine kinase
MSKTADESSHFSALRKMIFEALKSGKVEKKTYRRRKKRQMKKTRRRAKSKTADVVVLEGGRYFSNRAGFRR